MVLFARTGFAPLVVWCFAVLRWAWVLSSFVVGFDLILLW